MVRSCLQTVKGMRCRDTVTKNFSTRLCWTLLITIIHLDTMDIGFLCMKVKRSMAISSKTQATALSAL